MNQNFLGQRRLPNRFEIQFDTFRKLTWKERWKILIGFNVVVKVAVRVDKRSGRSWTSCHLSLTELESQAAVINENNKKDLESGVGL